MTFTGLLAITTVQMCIRDRPISGCQIIWSSVKYKFDPKCNKQNFELNVHWKTITFQIYYRDTVLYKHGCGQIRMCLQICLRSYLRCFNLIYPLKRLQWSIKWGQIEEFYLWSNTIQTTGQFVTRGMQIDKWTKLHLHRANWMQNAIHNSITGEIVE